MPGQYIFRSLYLFFFVIFFVLSFESPGTKAEGASITGRVLIVDSEGKPKEDNSGVVVFLDEVENLPQVPAADKTAEIQQINKQFVPNILPVVEGTTVSFPNNDNIYHNAFSLSKTKPFDLEIYAQGVSKSVTFDKSGLVKIYCNIHPEMVGYILVLPHPYFTMTGKEGHFEIPDVPLGSMVVRSWYPKSRTYPERQVVVTEDGIRDLNLSLIEDVRLQIKEESISIKHTNKWGQDYPAKY